jgi:hypothetical protein
MILLHDLKEFVRLDRSKQMCVHVVTCTNYNLNACGSCGADKTRVFLRLVAEMNDRFLEQRINNKFC